MLPRCAEDRGCQCQDQAELRIHEEERGGLFNKVTERLRLEVAKIVTKGMLLFIVGPHLVLDMPHPQLTVDGAHCPCSKHSLLVSDIGLR